MYVLQSLVGGRVPVMLLDTGLAENQPEDRATTNQLYVGDDAYRLKQEIVLGIGDVRMLHALGFNVRVYHMNEAHSALLGIELLQQNTHPSAEVQAGESLYDTPKVRGLCRFTTSHSGGCGARSRLVGSGEFLNSYLVFLRGFCCTPTYAHPRRQDVAKNTAAMLQL